MAFNISYNKQLNDSQAADLNEIELIPILDGDNKKSWLTIENKTTLSILSLLINAFLFLVDLLIDYFNRYSKDFRIVSHILAKEKLLLKQEYGNSQTPALMDLITTLKHEELKRPTLYQLLEKEDKGKIITTALEEIDSEMNSQSRFDKFISSTFYFLLSESEIICYFFLILNHLKQASLLSVPLPISVFLWAMLGVPRPKKSFWITIITYIEAIVVIKYIFQFKFYSWNQETNNAADQTLLKAIRIFGIDRNPQFAIYDLFALLVIFLHRTVLKVNLI